MCNIIINYSCCQWKEMNGLMNSWAYILEALKTNCTDWSYKALWKSIILLFISMQWFVFVLFFSVFSNLCFFGIWRPWNFPDNVFLSYIYAKMEKSSNLLNVQFVVKLNGKIKSIILKGLWYLPNLWTQFWIPLKQQIIWQQI